MANTKERIVDTALELFAQSGYVGTSMNDIAKQLGISKAALYKHYTGKQEILDRIIECMNTMNHNRAEKFSMPDGTWQEASEEYRDMPEEKIRTYSRAQFLHWTEEPFCAQFRKMLTLEQYRDPQMAALYQEHLVEGPVNYMTAIFQGMLDTERDARQMALAFYGPIYLLYSLYDKAEEKQSVLERFDQHVDWFIQYMKEKRGE